LLPAPLDWDNWEPWAWRAAGGARAEAAAKFAASHYFFGFAFGAKKWSDLGDGELKAT